MALICSRVVEDAFYGDLDIRTEGGDRVEVSGEQVPTVAIDRSAGTEPDRFTPIGSRDQAKLRMTVGGDEVALHPGKGKLLRRTYRIDVTNGKIHYRFRPNSVATAQLVRDGAKIVEFSMRDEDGDFLVQWLVERDDSQPADAAVGYALSVAFRTGAMSAHSALLHGLAELLPG
jgi:hypothetical protein